MIERLPGQRPQAQRETAQQAREAAQVKKGQVRPDAGPLVDRPLVEGAPHRPYRDLGGRYASLPEPLPEGALRLTPRQPRARLIQAVTAWLRANLAEGPLAADSFRIACRKRKISARVLKEARQRANIVTYLAPDGSDTWGLLREGGCAHCGETLLCRACGRSALLPQGVDLLYPLSRAARLLLMKPDSLRTYLNRHKIMYPARYRRRRGGSYERVLTGAEVRMLHSYVLHSTLYGKRKIGPMLHGEEEGR